MSGKQLKEILSSDGVNLSELAKKLGFANDQRLHSALKAADVKSGLLEAIAGATNKSVGYYYNDSREIHHSQQAFGSDITQNMCPSSDVSAILTEISEMRKLLSEQINLSQEQFNRFMSVIELLAQKQ